MWQKLKELKDELGADLLMELIGDFLTDTKQRLAALHIAVGKADFSTLTLEAIALKGSCGSLGIGPMDQLCEILERQGRERDLPAATVTVEKLEREFNGIRRVLETLISDSSPKPKGYKISYR